MTDGERSTVESATVDDVDDVTDLWVALAEDQRSHGSEPGRGARVGRAFGRHR